MPEPVARTLQHHTQCHPARVNITISLVDVAAAVAMREVGLLVLETVRDLSNLNCGSSCAHAAEGTEHHLDFESVR